MERVQNLANLMELCNNNPQFAELCDLLMNNPFWNGRRLEDSSEPDRRRMGPPPTYTPGLMQQVQNMYNSMMAMCTNNYNPQFAHLCDFLKNNPWNGRRRVQDSSEPDRRRYYSGWSEDESPSLIERTQ